MMTPRKSATDGTTISEGSASKTPLADRTNAVPIVKSNKKTKKRGKGGAKSTVNPERLLVLQVRVFLFVPPRYAACVRDRLDAYRVSRPRRSYARARNDT